MSRKRQPSRADRWHEAAGDLREAVSELEAVLERARTAAGALADVQSEYQDWLDNLPDGLRSSPVGDKLEAVVALDCDAEDAEGLAQLADEAEGIDLPLGWGRD